MSGCEDRAQPEVQNYKKIPIRISYFTHIPI